MESCPHAIRPELEALPPRIQRLPVDDRGYPVPWFVDWVDGKPEFRATDPMKWKRAVSDRLCWVCGDPLGAHLTFVIGPMCGINRTTAEPACHLECAEWSARNCPFLVRPQMVRREDDVINNETLREQSAGTALTRNPGVTLLWTTKSFRLFPDCNGRFLIQVGDPTRVQWFARGRLATRAEVEASVESGLPALMALAEQQDRQEGLFGAPQKELQQMKARFVALYPAATEITDQEERMENEKAGHEGAVENDAPTPPSGTVVSDQGDGATGATTEETKPHPEGD